MKPFCRGLLVHTAAYVGPDLHPALPYARWGAENTPLSGAINQISR